VALSNVLQRSVKPLVAIRAIIHEKRTLMLRSRN
jgi:hypothetical protein